MNPNEFQISLSSIDTERFDVKTARAINVTPVLLEVVLEFCKINDIKLLIARCEITNIEAVQAMEAEGFFLTDTLIYYEGNTQSLSSKEETKAAIIRRLATGEERIIQELAAISFKGYFSHYHADRRLNREKCDEAYASWAYRSCVSKDVADEVFVIEKAKTIAGFVSIKMHDSKTAEFVLNAVHPNFRKLGVYSLLFSGTKRLLFQRGFERIIISTQLPNVAVQKVWAREGFWLSHGYYTFHKWFD